MPEAGDGRAGRRERPTGDQVGGTWPVKREAADLLRRILDELPRSAADEGTLRSILEPLRSAADSLTAAGTQRRDPTKPWHSTFGINPSPLPGRP